MQERATAKQVERVIHAGRMGSTCTGHRCASDRIGASGKTADPGLSNSRGSTRPPDHALHSRADIRPRTQ